MQHRQKQERRQIEEYDRQSQARREALAASFEREKQVCMNACCVHLCIQRIPKCNLGEI